MRVYNFVVSGPKFTNFFRPIGDEKLIKYFSDFRYVDAFLRYLRSNSKVVKNREEFWTFFTLPPVKLVSTRAFFNAQWRTKCAVINWKCVVIKGCLCSDKTIYQCMKMFRFKDLRSTMSFYGHCSFTYLCNMHYKLCMTVFITQQLL